MRKPVHTELLQVRVSPKLKEAVEYKAELLGVRTTDVLRMALIDIVYGDVLSESIENTSPKETE
jgi:antitoxin component of RelBE/YafQ-DinJ toxin-antitoxin module